MTGEQRLHQVETKVRIIAARELRQFLAGEIPILPCSGWGGHLSREIAREFDRLDTARSRKGEVG